MNNGGQVRRSRLTERIAMFLFVVIISILLGSIVLVMIVGSLLPARYTIEFSEHLASPPSDVWSALHSPEEYPVGTKQCRGVELLSEDGGSWLEKLGPSQVTYERLESEKPKRLVITGADSVVPLSFQVEITLTPDGDGTLVGVSGEGEIASGTLHVPLFRVIIHLGGAKAGLRSYIRSLAR